MEQDEQKIEAAKSVIQQLKDVVKFVPKLYQCEVCKSLFKKTFFVSVLFKGFPVIKFCSSKCRFNRPKGRIHEITTPTQ